MATESLDVEEGLCDVTKLVEFIPNREEEDQYPHFVLHCLCGSRQFLGQWFAILSCSM